MYFVKTPNIIRLFMPKLVCRIPNNHNNIFLTFDDGPTPEITPWVLDELKKYSAKATFFCLGQHVKSNPLIFERIVSEGHTIGNHSFSHLNGWNNNNRKYFDDVEKAGSIIPTKLFRPPFGTMKYSQYNALKEIYKLVLWDVMPGDFDETLSKENCLLNVLRYSKSGSIVVFHDTLKAEQKLRFVLPEILIYFTKMGFLFNSIEIG
jgi:peptidoglycan-N-acetylglucosamine deacetylase